MHKRKGRQIALLTPNVKNLKISRPERLLTYLEKVLKSYRTVTCPLSTSYFAI